MTLVLHYLLKYRFWIFVSLCFLWLVFLAMDIFVFHLLCAFLAGITFNLSNGYTHLKNYIACPVCREHSIENCIGYWENLPDLVVKMREVHWAVGAGICLCLSIIAGYLIHPVLSFTIIFQCAFLYFVHKRVEFDAKSVAFAIHDRIHKEHAPFG